MNPIFIEYYSHLESDCYKIYLPWTEYHEFTMVLCPVSEGYEKAKKLAVKAINEHLEQWIEDESTCGIKK